MTILASIGEDMHLTLVAGDGNTNLYPRALIFDEAGTPTPIATLDMEHVAEGYYRSTLPFNVATSEKFVAIIKIYEDPARTIESSSYTRAEQIIVSDFIPQGLVGSSS